MIKTLDSEYEDHEPVLPAQRIDNRPPVQIAAVPVTEIDDDFTPADTEALLKALGSWKWRMFSGALYRIIIKGEEGQPDTSLPFIPNRAQRRLLSSLHNRNVILKARQLGITTLIAILFLDHALFQREQRVGIIAQTGEVAEEIFADKVKFAYDNLPEFLREKMPAVSNSATKLSFAHSGSSIRVATSMRGGTIHRLHISELGKIAKESPKKAREIVTGSMQAVPMDGITTIESTAEGQEGEFFNIASRAEAHAQERKELTKAEFRFFFFPWFMEDRYRINPRGVTIRDSDHVYFATVEAEMKVTLDDEQRAFYVSKRDNDFSGDVEKMWQEWPSTPTECWQKSTEGTYYAPQLARARMENRITVVPHISRIRVNTFWDIGSGDGTGIWLHQYVGNQHRFISYLEDYEQGYDHYVNLLRGTGYVFGGMFLPHDADQKRQMAHKVGAPIDMLRELAPDWSFHIVPRVETLSHGITLMRALFPQCVFDKRGCEAGLNHLALYRKRWNKMQGAWADEPESLHIHTQAADAIRQCAQGFDPALIGAQKTLDRTKSARFGARVT
jgi:hypothetical protein